MKLSPLFLVGSIAANVILVFALAQRPAVHGYLFRSPTGSSTQKTRVHSNAAEPPALSSWDQLQTAQLSDVVARLRADGVSPRMLRVIVGALVRQQFAGRHQAVVDALSAKPWWQGQPYEAYNDPIIKSMRRQLSHEEYNVIYQLLGPVVPETDYDRAFAEQRYGSLSPDKTEKLRRINTDYNDLATDLRNEARNVILPEDSDRLAYLEQERLNDINQLLSPEELFEFNLHSGPTAKRVRNQLEAFDPSEEEYRAIFKIQQAVDAPFGNGRVQDLTQDERRQKRDLSIAAAAQIQTVLSPERFADYEFKTDPTYLKTNQLVTELQLPATSTTEIVTVQKDITSRMQAVLADNTQTPDQRIAQLTALDQEAKAASRIISNRWAIG
jgi:hypothetical protein